MTTGNFTANSERGHRALISLSVLMEETEITKNKWIEHLRNNDIVAARPNDGWVNREKSKFTMAYPLFVDKEIEAGDLVALGWPAKKPYDGGYQKYMIVRVTGIERRFLTWYRYEVLGDITSLETSVKDIGSQNIKQRTVT